MQGVEALGGRSYRFLSTVTTQDGVDDITSSWPRAAQHRGVQQEKISIVLLRTLHICKVHATARVPCNIVEEGLRHLQELLAPVGDEFSDIFARVNRKCDYITLLEEAHCTAKYLTDHWSTHLDGGCSVHAGIRLHHVFVELLSRRSRFRSILECEIHILPRPVFLSCGHLQQKHMLHRSPVPVVTDDMGTPTTLRGETLSIDLQGWT
mmetsp:Transcript_9483/g.26495  ORF Transcript_9483/g.26495 Transcript_9483/m.26495 type:complete len:208 (+) Transcript_9483:364-987(+)